MGQQSPFSYARCWKQIRLISFSLSINQSTQTCDTAGEERARRLILWLKTGNLKGCTQHTEKKIKQEKLSRRLPKRGREKKGCNVLCCKVTEDRNHVVYQVTIALATANPCWNTEKPPVFLSNYTSTVTWQVGEILFGCNAFSFTNIIPEGHRSCQSPHFLTCLWTRLRNHSFIFYRNCTWSSQILTSIPVCEVCHSHFCFVSAFFTFPTH